MTSSPRQANHLRRVVSIRRLADDLATIKADVAAMRVRTAQTDQKLDGLISHTARTPDGRSLITVVGEILSKVS
jgi:hypothetical protein